jgi:diaminopimelate epimerase
MQYPFAKYEGLGNDFIVLDARQWPEALVTPALAKRLCDRHRSVGGDGVLWVEPRQDGAARMVIYNQDGSRPEMCGNGVRCVAAYLADLGEAQAQSTLVILSDAGPRPVVIQTLDEHHRWSVTVEMGLVLAEARAFTEVPLSHSNVPVYFADAGNPHAVLFVRADHEDVTLRGSREAAAALVRAHHERYPRGTNVEFVCMRDDRSLRVAVHERGGGWTLACGTGACAAAAVTAARGAVERGEYEVELDGGALTIEVEREREGAYRTSMTGPARRAFRGYLEQSEMLR